MGKSVINKTEGNMVTPSEGSKPSKDVTDSRKQANSSSSGNPLKGSGMGADAPSSSKPDSWVKGGDSGKFEGPDSRRKHNFGS